MTPRPRLIRDWTRLALVGLTFLLAGCGPSVKLSLTLREASLDTAYGAPKQVVQLPPQPAGQVNPAGFPGFVAPFFRDVVSAPASAAPIPSTASQVACPPGYARSLPDRDAGNLVIQPPPEATYQFLRQGSHLEGSGPSRPYSADVRRQVTHEVTGQHPSQAQSPNATTDNVFTYDQIQYEGARQTTTTYWVEDGSNGGIKIAQIIAKSSPTDPNPVVFQPARPLRIAMVPLGIETSSTQEVESDPVHGITYQINHQTTGQVLMQTCGQAYYAWKEVVSGQYFTTLGRTSYNINATYYIVPRLGGLIIGDDVEITNSQSPPVGTQYDDHQADTIAQVLPGV